VDAKYDYAIHSAYAKLYQNNNDFNLDFTNMVKDELIMGIPPELLVTIPAASISLAVSFAILYMFMPRDSEGRRSPQVKRSVQEKYYDPLSPKRLDQFIKQAPDDDRPRLTGLKKIQPYILRDLPRKIRENMPVPNYETEMVWDKFKSVPDDLQDLTKQIIVEGAKSGADVDEVKNRLMNEVGLSDAKAELLAVNEIRRARHFAYRKVSEQLGFDRQYFHANPIACPICKGIDGNIYPVDVAVIPDLTHPNCDCQTFTIPSSNVDLDDIGVLIEDDREAPFMRVKGR
jgi:hypothetical protein